MDKKKESVFIRIRNKLASTGVFRTNEIQSNRMVVRILIYSAILVALTGVLIKIGFFPLDISLINTAIVQGIIELLVPIVLSTLVHHEKWWVKYMLLLAMNLVYARLDMIMNFKVAMLMVMPVLVSSRYFSRWLTGVTAVTSVILFGVSSYLGALYGLLDMNIVSLPAGTVLTSNGGFIGEGVREMGLDPGMLTSNTMLYTYLPRLFIFLLIALVSMNIARRGREMVLEQEQITESGARIESELMLARDIQAHMLPVIFPAFPEHKEFDIYAIMTPAREVAGDFYDFFMVDDSHLGMVMADVSGKGIPAALFMVISKTLIKNYAESGMAPNEVFKTVNSLLCEGNDAGFFVTAWLGVLDLDTGHLVYSNAGHTPPLITRNGRYEYLHCKPGFILGGMEGVKFRSEELDMAVGDSIFLYTDGIPEAEDTEKNLYGNDRLQKLLNSRHYEDMEQLCKAVEESVNEYAEGVEQFDDITMLSMIYLGGSPKRNVIRVPANLESIAAVTEYANGLMAEHEVPEPTAIQIDIVIDELFSNIARYGYPDGPGEAEVEVAFEEDPDRIVLTFNDEGIAFDPTAQPDPDVSGTLEKRKVGGLGLFMVRKTTDGMQYERKDGHNILTVTKNYKKV